MFLRRMFGDDEPLLEDARPAPDSTVGFGGGVSEKVVDGALAATIARLEDENDRLHQRLEGAEKAAPQTLARAEEEHGQVEEELAQARDLMNTFLETTTDQVYFKDRASRFILVSNTFVRRLGLESADEAIGKTDFDYFTEEHARRAYENEQRIVRTGEPLVDVEEKEVRKDGRVTWFMTTKMPLRDGLGNVIGTYGISRDITADKRAEEKHGQVEEELAQERHLMNIFLDTTTDGVYFKDRESRFIRISAALAKHLSLGSPDEAIGKTDFDFFTDEHARPAYEDEQRIIRTGEPLVDIEEKETWKDGQVGWVSTTKVPLRDEAGNIIGTYGMSRDITGRKRVQEEQELIEEQLRQSQKMEAIGQLAGGIAHDFNNLLTAIKGYAELAAVRAQGGELSSDIEQILDAARRAADLTRQLLAFSRRQTLQPQPIHLNELIHNIEKLLRRLIGEHIELRTLLTPEPVWIEADASQMEQMIVNLAINARDAMPRGGVLTLELGATPETAVVTVSDTGLGMDEETRAHAFEPFFTTKEPGEGTGLGLATVDGIVAQSGGAISLESAPGVGTTFTITLQRVEPAAAPPAVASIGEQQGRGRVLVVEDEEAVRKVTRRFLENAGFEVLEASGGDEALAILDEGETVDVMLTDVVMPGISGPELSRLAVIRKPTLSVVFCSGYPHRSIDTNEDLPSWAMLPKPFNSDELVEAICAASERTRSRS